MGEMWTIPHPRIFEWNRGEVRTTSGHLSFVPRASDVVVVEINYKTGRVWVEPARM